MAPAMQNGCKLSLVGLNHGKDVSRPEVYFGPPSRRFYFIVVTSTLRDHSTFVKYYSWWRGGGGGGGGEEGRERERVGVGELYIYSRMGHMLCMYACNLQLDSCKCFSFCYNPMQVFCSKQFILVIDIIRDSSVRVCDLQLQEMIFLKTYSSSAR